MSDQNTYTAMAKFDAQLEGQISISPNDPLLLLNDENKLWWYVKNITTDQVGYVPAEYVELPFERIARFNRAKNIQETKPLETDTARFPSEKKKKVEFAALVDYDVLPEPPAGNQSGFSIFRGVAITKWLSKKSIKTSKWLRKYVNFGQSKLDLLKVYVDNFESKSLFKTILMDDTMTIDNLVATSMKRFGLENHNPQNFFVSLALDQTRIRPDRNELVKTAFSKYISVIDQGTGRVYLSKETSPLRVDSKSVTSASLASQKKLSNRVSLLGSTVGTKFDVMTFKEFDSALETFFDEKYTENVVSALKNIEGYQELYAGLESNRDTLSSEGKIRSKSQYEEALLQFNDHLGDDVKENLELVKCLQQNLEAILLISVKMCEQ